MFNDFPFELSVHISSFLRGHLSTLRSVALTCRDGRDAVRELRQEEVRIYNELVQQLATTRYQEQDAVMANALKDAIANNHNYVICKAIEDHYTQPQNPYQNMPVNTDAIFHLAEQGLLDYAAKMRALNPASRNFLASARFNPHTPESTFHLWRMRFRCINDDIASNQTFSCNLPLIHDLQRLEYRKESISRLISGIRGEIQRTLPGAAYQKYAPKLHDEFYQVVANLLYKLYKSEWRVRTFPFYAKQLLAKEEKLGVRYTNDNPYPQILAKVKAMDKAPKPAAAAPSLKR